MRPWFLAAAFAAVTACGGGANVSGPIGSACMDAGRQAASAALCSCVQRVANQSLSGSEQTRAARFFETPDLAQETRQSDAPRDKTFWARYKLFTERAEQICRASS